MFKGDNTLNYIGGLKDPWVVVCAANRHVETGLIVTGARHLDSVMRTQIFALSGSDHTLSVDFNDNFDDMVTDNGGWYSPACQGFIDNYGDWLTREEAWYVADKAGQIINQNEYGREGYLYSENLY
jgi:hypothetical protein